MTMELIFYEGFDQFQSGFPGIGTINQKWILGGGSFQPGRFGGLAHRPSGRSEAAYNKPGPWPSVIIGFALRFGTWVQQSPHLVAIREQTLPHIMLLMNSAQQLVVVRGGNLDGIAIGTETLATSSFVFAEDTWYYVELAVTIHPTNGSFKIRINGADDVQASGLNTRREGAFESASYRFSIGGVWGLFSDFDDLYIFGGTEWSLNDFLGDVRVSTAMPVGNGAFNQWSPISGDNFENVNEEQIDYDVSYIHASPAQSGVRDSYGIGPLSADMGQIHAVQVSPAFRKEGAESYLVNPFMRVNVTNYDGDQVGASTSWLIRSQLLPLNPATAAPWSKAEVEASEIGVRMEVP